MRKLPHFLDKGDHSCGFYRDEGEKLRIALPFFRAGLLLGEKCIFIGSETDFSVIKTAIRDNKKSGSGVDEEKIMHIDSSAYLKAFQAGDFKALCGQWELLVKGFLAEGFRAIRGVGCLDMEYSPELESFLLEYEKCIAPLFHRYPVSAICLYSSRYAKTPFGRKVSTAEYHPVLVDPILH